MAPLLESHEHDRAGLSTNTRKLSKMEAAKRQNLEIVSTQPGSLFAEMAPGYNSHQQVLSDKETRGYLE